MTFRELYLKTKDSKTPTQSFVDEVANITHRSEMTVRFWAYGMQEPDDLAKSVLEKHFSVPADELFPSKKTDIVGRKH